MNLRRLSSIIRKEFRQLLRDQESLRLFIVAPVFQLLMFGIAVSTDLRGVSLGVVTEDPSPAARGLVRTILATEAFVLTESSARPDAAVGWLDTGAAQVVVHIPRGFGKAVSRGEAPTVQVLSDGSDSNTAALAYQYLSGAALTWANRECADRFAAHPERAVRFAGVPRVEVEPRFWYNPELRSRNFTVPGVTAIVLLMLALVQTSLVVVKERELGTLEQLSVTPIRGVELLIAKTLPSSAAALLVAALTVIVAVVGFRVPLRGSVPFLVFSGMLFMLSTTGLGLLVSVLSRSQIQAQLTANFIAMPLVLLSGFLFPIANMPAWAQWLTYVMPTRYYIEITRGVFLKGLGFAGLWPQAAALALLGTVLYAAGILMFRKQTG